MKVVKAHIKLHWGFSIRKPFFSASQPSYKTIPPTTLIGALARVHARVKGDPEVIYRDGSLYSSTIRILGACRWATIAYIDENLSKDLGVIETRDIMRAVIATYVRRDHVYPGSKMLYAPQPHGKIYFPDLDMEVAYIVSDDFAEKALRMVWGIVALGCKEAIASTINARILDLRMIKDNVVKTRFYFPSDAARAKGGKYIEEQLTIPCTEHYRLASAKLILRNFIVPLDLVTAVVDSNVGLALADDEGDVYIVYKEVVKDL